MADTIYDIPISEVAKILDKSDRQVRRYVKERRLNAKSVRVDGHIKLMFSAEEVSAFKERFSNDGISAESAEQMIVDAQFVDDQPESQLLEDHPADTPKIDASDGVKYVVDALREQLSALRTENRDLHYQLEQRSGQVGFLQGKIEALQEEVKALSPVPRHPRPWYRRWFSKE